jgi:hypothetical protein
MLGGRFREVDSGRSKLPPSQSPRCSGPYRRNVACSPVTSVEMAKLRVSARSSGARWAEAAINSDSAHAETKQITSPYENSLRQFQRVPSIIVPAEEMTAWPHKRRPVGSSVGVAGKTHPCPADSRLKPPIT